MIALTIAGTDRTQRVELNSLVIDNILTTKRDTCKFSILVNPSDSFTPIVGQEVIVTLDSDRVFGGVITLLEQEALSYKLLRWKISCEDYTRLLDRKLVPDSFQGMTANAILQSLKDNFFPPGFTINGVDAPVLIRSVSFNYKPVSKCIQEIADAIGYDWYVDYNKDVHLFSALDVAAPFDIEDDNGKFIYDSLVIRRDNSQIRNSVIVRGGKYEASNFTAELVADGSQNYFPMPFEFAFPGFNATLTGQDLNVGEDVVDNPDLFDATLNNPEKILKFRDARRPSAGATLRFGGKPLLPLIVRVRDNASISTLSSVEGGDGVYEFLIKDESITTRDGARQRGRAELATYAQTLSEGEFQTQTAGLRAGMKIMVNSASRGIKEAFVINRVTLRQFETGSFQYNVSLVTTKTFDLIDLLVRFSLQQNKDLVIREGEEIDLVESVTESFGPVADSASPATFTGDPLDYPVEFCAGNFTGDVDTPQGYKRIFIIYGSPLH